jgi:hypothetical protein
MPVARLLDDRLAGVQDGGVPLDLVADGVFDGAQRVDVLRLGANAEAFAAVRAERDVASQRTLPRSIFASDTPRFLTISRTAATYALASSGARLPAPSIGLVTISTSGTPERL